jgi:hypothetical protein
MMRWWILMFAATLAYGQAVVIRTSTLLDGQGHVLKNTDLTIEGGRIARIGAAKGKAAIDLTGLSSKIHPCPATGLAGESACPTTPQAS